MIRMVLACFAFAVVICALIIVRPFSNAPVAAHEQGPEFEVTRAAPLDGELPRPAATRPPAPAITRPATDSGSMQDMTALVLAELGLDTGAPAPDDRDQIEATAAILASIQTITGQPRAVTPRDTLASLVATALREGQSDAYIDVLVNEAAAAGRISVPQVIVTSDGRVDTAVLLNDLVTQAIVASGGVAPDRPAAFAEQAVGVEVRVVQRAADSVEARFYTVQPGDSLGAIAVRFFGRVDAYERIFLANRQILASPDRIRAGQRLVIPETGSL